MQIYGFGDNTNNNIEKIHLGRGSRFQKNAQLAALSAIVYQIWIARNDPMWNGKVDRITTHVNRIQRACIDRVYSIISEKITRRERENG